MNKSEFLGLNLPSRDNTTDIADINAISDNFKTIDNVFLDLVEKQIPEFQTKENINLNFDDDSTNEEQYPSVPAVVNFTNRKVDPLKIVNSASGNAIALKDSANHKLQGLKLYGKTTQDGTPTPDNPIELKSVGDSGSFEVGVYGKNLCDGVSQGYYINGARNVYGRTSSGADNGVAIPISANTYTISTTITQERLRVACANSLLSLDTNASCYNGMSADGTSNNLTIDCTGYSYLIVNATDLSAIQVEIGTEATPYEKPNKQTLTMPYTLRGVGDIKDEVDFTRGVYTSNFILHTLTTVSSVNELTNCLRVGVFLLSTPKQAQSLCSHLSYYESYGSDTEHFYCATHNNIAYLFINKSRLSAYDKDTVQAWIISQGVKILYEIPPTETPLTETELNAYRQLMTNKGNTTILSEADMEVDYVADTKLYIDNKIAELTALTLEG